MKQFVADLHIHTRLSPCASEEMTPPAITDQAGLVGIDILAICDHNSSGNVAAVLEAARGRSLLVIPGIELETAERIHVLGLFPSLTEALAVSEQVRRTLPGTDEEYAARVGMQILMRADGEPCGVEDRALAAPTPFDLRVAVRLIQQQRGLAVAAHVERPAFSVYSQLGELPRDIPFDALEVSPVHNRPVGLREKFARYGYPLVASSDSHYLHELGRARSLFLLAAPTFEEISLAMQGREGRSVTYA